MRAQEFFNVSEPNNLWSILTAVHNVSTAISDSLSQFNWDVFLGVDSEASMEELAGDYQQQKDMGITYIIAGIVFEPGLSNLSANSSSFKATTIKIRTNFSSVVDTSEYKER